MEKQVIKVNGMNCGHCTNAVTEAIKELGVANVDVSLEKKEATVEFDPNRVSLDQIKAAITERGYEVA